MDTDITSKPFVALVVLENETDPCWPLFEAHLVNPTETEYQAVTVLTGAFATYDASLMETNKLIKNLGPLPPGSSSVIDRSDCDELYEHVVWFYLDLKAEGCTRPEMYTLHLPKCLSGYEAQATFLPIAGQRGMPIVLQPREDSETIEELAQTANMAGRCTKYNSEPGVHRGTKPS